MIKKYLCLNTPVLFFFIFCSFSKSVNGMTETCKRAPANVLIYYETNGFTHPSIDEGITLITDLGVANGLWNTTSTDDSSIFNMTDLMNVDLVIWCNTSGNNLLTTGEQQAFETWVKTPGKAFMGIHAATDTYRDGSWPFYNELVGAIVQTNPNHTSQNKVAIMDVLQEHSSADHLGTEWNKREEYYYWEQNGGQLSSDNNNVLFVRSTGGNSYDAPRPMAWYKTKITVNGVSSDVRAFYTALGHRESDYTSDINFQSHIEGAILWAIAEDETIFTNSGWSNGDPTVLKRAVIDADYNTGIEGPIIARELVINNGKTLDLTSGTTVVVSENITANGTLRIAHEGSLVQRDRAGAFEKEPSGIIEVNKITQVMKPRDFMFMSSPMTTETRDGVYGTIENFTTANVAPAFRVIYLNPENFQADPAVTSFPAYSGAETFLSIDNTFLGNYVAAETITPGEGLIVYPQESFEAGGLNAQYKIQYTKGVCNNGDVSFPIQYNGSTADNFNLLGNPYPSAIDISKFIAENPMVNEVYFWEHETTPNSTLPGYLGANPSMNDFSMRNLTTGMAAPNKPGAIPSQFMASGQGFAIKADQAAVGTNEIVFNNLMRVVGSNNQYRNTEENKELFWLRIEEEKYNLQSKTAIGFLEEASSSMDKGYDSKRMATPVSIYSKLASGEELGIQGTDPFSLEQELSIGYATAIEENNKYIISLEGVQGLHLTKAPIYLVDLFEERHVNLKDTSYTFYSNPINEANRFLIRFKEPSSSVINSPQFGFVAVYPNPSDEFVVIARKDTVMKGVLTIYNSMGTTIRKLILNTSKETIDVSDLKSGLYLFKINSGELEEVRKVIVR